jgi:peptide/nickel transport system permease protein
MGLSAALPADWPPLQVYFGITVILSLVGWTGLARVVRGRILQLREEAFVVAARLAGSRNTKIIFWHLLPSCMSYLIVSITLAVPGMILGETALSFLGLGLKEPVVSWGVLLQQAQNIRAVALYPWLMIPAILVIITTLAFNFLGDGLRDAADPYT